jgi:hypothetical protein
VLFLQTATSYMGGQPSEHELGSFQVANPYWVPGCRQKLEAGGPVGRRKAK